MLLRKFNAGLSLLSTLLLLDHAIFLAVWMLSRGTIPKSADFLAWVLMGLTLLHALISIDLVVSAYVDSDNHKAKSYAKLNLATIIQRISGVLTMLFMGLHIAGATGLMQPPKLVHAIVPPLFFVV